MIKIINIISSISSYYSKNYLIFPFNYFLGKAFLITNTNMGIVYHWSNTNFGMFHY